MGFLDKAKGLVGEHADQVKKGIDKAEGLAEKRLGKKYADKIATVGDKAAGFVDSLDDKGKPAPGTPSTEVPDDTGGQTPSA